MTVYLGNRGRLVKLPYASSQSLALSESMTLSTTLEGRVKAQARPRRNREWSMTAERYLAQAQGALAAFFNGEWGNGPFVWVSADAPVTNMLTPAQSSCDPSTLYTAGVIAGAPLDLGADGWAGRSFLNPDPATTFRFGGQGAPVLPKQKVTASAYVVGAGAKVQIRWEDAAGVYISTTTSTAQGLAGTPVRAFITATAPDNAALAYVNALSASQAARPALTWTAALFDWADGQGCPKAIIRPAGRELKQAHVDPAGLRAADMSFTITEVG